MDARRIGPQAFRPDHLLRLRYLCHPSGSLCSHRHVPGRSIH